MHRRRLRAFAANNHQQRLVPLNDRTRAVIRELRTYCRAKWYCDARVEKQGDQKFPHLHFL
jgi:hypothetical protein